MFIEFDKEKEERFVFLRGCCWHVQEVRLKMVQRQVLQKDRE